MGCGRSRPSKEKRNQDSKHPVGKRQFVSYCHVNNHHTFRGLKQYVFISSVLQVRSLVRCDRYTLLRVSQEGSQGVGMTVFSLSSACLSKPMLLWQNSISCSSRTVIAIRLLAVSWGCSQILRATCILCTWPFPASKPTAQDLLHSEFSCFKTPQEKLNVA